MSTLDDRLDADYAPAWRPDPGDKIEGEVVAIAERAGEYDPYPIVTVRRSDGEEFAIHAFHTVLAGEFAKLQLKLGDKIAVKYLGKKQNRAGNGSYHAYRVVKDGDEPLVNWTKYATGTDDDDSTPASDLPSDFPAPTGYGQPPAKPKDDGDDIPF
jgi:hypothetical protein